MADFLRRDLAPLTDAAWSELDSRAAEVLKTLLTGRTLVDFSGPHGWQHASVNLGRIELAEQPGPQAIPWGTRLVQPLVELRVPLTLSQLELDNIARGSRDPDFAPMEDAARRVAWFEENAIYNGFPQGRIGGILQRTSHPPVTLPPNGEEYPAAVARAFETITLAGIPGPYSLVLGKDPFFLLMQSSARAYLPYRVIQYLIGGKILMSPVLEGGVLLSTAPDQFELTVGQDLSIGYASHDRDNVELFFTESFTFRVLETAAAVELKLAAG